MANFDQVADSEVSLERTPGAMLRQAREAAGISAREMADRLNWMPRYITAIEANRFDEMRGTAYVRGYLLAYGKMLGVAEPELLDAFAAQQLPEESAATIDKTNKTGPFTQPPVNATVSGVVAAILLVLVFLWWQSDTEAPPAQEEPPAQKEVLTTEVVEQIPVEDVIAEQATVEEVRAEEAAVEEVKTEEAEQLEAELIELADSKLSPVVTYAGALLQFRFSGDCWLEVRDATERLIYADLHRAGQELGLDGQPPFTVKAGDSRYVQVHYDGEEFEIESRPGRVVATFTVGEP